MVAESGAPISARSPTLTVVERARFASVLARSPARHLLESADPVLDRRVVVVGAARSGIAAARLLVRRGARVTLSESRTAFDDAACELIDPNFVRPPRLVTAPAPEPKAVVVATFMVISYITMGDMSFVEQNIGYWYYQAASFFGLFIFLLLLLLQMQGIACLFSLNFVVLLFICLYISYYYLRIIYSNF